MNGNFLMRQAVWNRRALIKIPPEFVQTGLCYMFVFTHTIFSSPDCKCENDDDVANLLSFYLFWWCKDNRIILYCARNRRIYWEQTKKLFLNFTNIWFCLFFYAVFYVFAKCRNLRTVFLPVFSFKRRQRPKTLTKLAS